MTTVDRKHPMYRRNSKIVKSIQTDCGLCGEYVNKTKATYDPLSAVADHKLAVNQGGHLWDMKNLQLAHWYCNGQKSDRLEGDISKGERRAWALHIIQLTTGVEPSGIDWLSLIDNDQNDWLEENNDDEEE